MATVNDIIDSSRYDLRDYETGIVWDDAEILNYINRMVGIMDSQLAALNSDLVEAEERTIDCVANQNYVDLSSMNSGNWDSIRSVWIGQDILYKISMDLMRYKRVFRNDNNATWVTSTAYSVGDKVENNSIPYVCLVAHTSGTFATDLSNNYWETNYRTAQPQYFALSNRTILFETACPTAYTTLLIYYNKKTATLAATDNMPFDDIFNEFFRAQLSMYARARAGAGGQGDAMDTGAFRRRAMEEIIRRGFNPKPYYIDF
jgi:hypothetical protein